MTPQAQHLVGSLTPVAVIALILAIRLPRMLKGRRLRLETLWIRPAILLAIGALAIAYAPPRTLLDVAVLLIALVAGAALGWQQGKMMAIGIEPESHQLNVKASPFAVLLFAGLMVVRIGLREVLQQEAAAWRLNVNLVLDGLLALVVGLYIAQAVEMYLRASAMLRQVKAGGSQPG